MNTNNYNQGDKVFVLKDYDLIPSEVLSCAKKNVKVKISPYKGCIEHVSYVPYEKVISCSVPFCVVWDLTKGRNGRGSYRIETTLYKEFHTVGWKSTSAYIREE